MLQWSAKSWVIASAPREHGGKQVSEVSEVSDEDTVDTLDGLLRTSSPASNRHRRSEDELDALVREVNR